MSVAESIRRRLHIKPHHTTKNPEGGASAEVDKLKAELSRSRTDLGKVRSELLSLKEEYEASKATSTSEIKKAREQAAAEIKAAEANLEAVEHKMLVLENERKAAAAAKVDASKKVNAMRRASHEVLASQMEKAQELALASARAEMAKMAEASPDETKKMLLEAREGLKAAKDDAIAARAQVATSQKEIGRLKTELAGALKAAAVAEGTLAEAIVISANSQEVSLQLVREIAMLQSTIQGYEDHSHHSDDEHSHHESHRFSEMGAAIAIAPGGGGRASGASAAGRRSSRVSYNDDWEEVETTNAPADGPASASDAAETQSPPTSSRQDSQEREYLSLLSLSDFV